MPMTEQDWKLAEEALQDTRQAEADAEAQWLEDLEALEVEIHAAWDELEQGDAERK